MTFWRAGVDYGGATTPKWDFIPSTLMPAFFTTEHLVGALPPADFNGLQVLGSYGDAWLIESHYMPAGYVIVAATGGLDSDLNPVGVRHHVNPAYHGLRHIPGAGPTRCRSQLLRARVRRRRRASWRSRRHAGHHERDLHRRRPSRRRSADDGERKDCRTTRLWHGRPDGHPSFPGGRGSCRPARRARRRAKAACTEGSARRSSSPVAKTSACGQNKPDGNRATHRAATPVSGWLVKVAGPVAAT